ncbi:putative ABC transporter ATP-binding protein MA_0394 [Clostridium bornimense]|uniref:ABC transporter ATP-binding protein n=1 Tax=Clostridium bornimense TaxID=1216932 RepID=W6S7H1_9CLOT|nr:ABC transporter ATP-binding protein [Clostridium bornimense]CDM70357.1 putative ABC transporter ATP-binding protein MA_0394 [Clostridium bornimense]
MKNPILEIRNLNYSYNSDKKALNNITLSINKGEKIAFLGANGAGKSTFFLNLNGVLHPDSGDIIYDGIIMTSKNLNTLRKNIGMVFQDADNQIIASTVFSEVSFGPMNMKLPIEEVKSRVTESLEYMNITSLKDRPPHYLSGGEKKRVTIADIIAMKSEIIIFDEPTASLDPLNINLLEDVLSKLYDDGKTLLISTHDVDFAYKWATRIILFANGTIIADDIPVNIFKNQSILKEANLKTPILFDVYEMLKEKNNVTTLSYPRTIDEMKLLIDNL